MPMKCLPWSALTLRLVPCLLILALWIAGGCGMSDHEVQDLRFVLSSSTPSVAETEEFQ